MAAGKNYLKTSLMGGVPAEIQIYYNEDASILSTDPADIASGTIGAHMMVLPVFVDGGGQFILSPLDPASITGLAAYCA